MKIPLSAEHAHVINCSPTQITAADRNNTKILEEYLEKERVTFEIYQERKIVNHKRTSPPTYNEPRKKRKLEET